ncbi:MAG: hypothetical protein R3199_05230 [Gemmatimonadota bacterium]|nr:hypothetical protein [Gemmatimonadota bacterium]
MSLPRSLIGGLLVLLCLACGSSNPMEEDGEGFFCDTGVVFLADKGDHWQVIMRAVTFRKRVIVNENGNLVEQFEKVCTNFVCDIPKELAPTREDAVTACRGQIQEEGGRI